MSGAKAWCDKWFKITDGKHHFYSTETPTFAFIYVHSHKKKKKNFRKVCWQHNINLHIKSKLSPIFYYFSSFFLWRQNEKWPITLVKCFSLYDRYHSSGHHRFCFDRTKNQKKKKRLMNFSVWLQLWSWENTSRKEVGVNEWREAGEGWGMLRPSRWPQTQHRVSFSSEPSTRQPSSSKPAALP